MKLKRIAFLSGLAGVLMLAACQDRATLGVDAQDVNFSSQNEQAESEDSPQQSSEEAPEETLEDTEEVNSDVDESTPPDEESEDTEE